MQDKRIYSLFHAKPDGSRACFCVSRSFDPMRRTSANASCANWCARRVTEWC